MENKKTPEQWFMQLKEPYRSQAIANIDKESINKYYTSINKALCTSFVWSDSKQGDDYWVKISSSLEKGETTYLEPEQQNQIESEKVETDWKAKFEELQKRYEVLVTEAHKLDVLSGEMCDKYTKLKDNYEKLSAYNDELTERINQAEKKNNQEKVYFYIASDLNWYASSEIDWAIEHSEDNKPIYGAVCIGYKQSVLVSE